MRHHLHNLFFGIAWASLLAGCVEANPQPSPIDIDPQRILVSTPGAEQDEVAIVGLSDAVPGAGEVEVAGDDGAPLQARFETTAEGSFVGTVQATAGSRLLLTFVQSQAGEERRSEAVALTVASPSTTRPEFVDWQQNGGSQPGNVGVELPSAPLPDDASEGKGLIVVSGAAGSVPSQAEVVVGNRSNGAVATTTAGSDGSFSLTIAGETGDSLVVFAVKADETQVTTDIRVVEAGSATDTPAPAAD